MHAGMPKGGTDDSHGNSGHAAMQHDSGGADAEPMVHAYSIRVHAGGAASPGATVACANLDLTRVHALMQSDSSGTQH